MGKRPRLDDETGELLDELRSLISKKTNRYNKKTKWENVHGKVSYNMLIKNALKHVKTQHLLRGQFEQI